MVSDLISIVSLYRKVLPSPKSLLEIAQKGVDHEAYATVCLYELMNQLKRQTKYPVLVAVGERRRK